MQNIKETKIYLTNAYDPFGDGFFNIFKTNHLNQVFVLVKNKNEVLYFKTIKIDDGSLVYDYTTLYKNKIADFKKLYSSKLIDSFDKYDVNYQYILLKHLIFIVDNGVWEKNDEKLDIKLIIEIITNLIFKYNQLHRLIRVSPYYINGNDLYLRWNTYYQYALYKTPIGINTTNNPYVVLSYDEFYNEVVFVNINDLNKVYIINAHHFNQYYFQKISKFNYWYYHTSYQDVELMQSVFETIAENDTNQTLEIYQINFANELKPFNDNLHIRLSVNQYIENMQEKIKNCEKFNAILEKLEQNNDVKLKN